MLKLFKYYLTTVPLSYQNTFRLTSLIIFFCLGAISYTLNGLEDIPSINEKLPGSQKILSRTVPFPKNINKNLFSYNYKKIIKKVVVVEKKNITKVLQGYRFSMRPTMVGSSYKAMIADNKGNSFYAKLGYVHDGMQIIVINPGLILFVKLADVGKGTPAQLMENPHIVKYQVPN